MYDPSVGRWLSQDPIGFQAGDPNLYRYVGNKVTTHTDPSGLEETASPSGSTDDPFSAFPPLPIVGLPVKTVKPKSPEDTMNVSIDEFLIRLLTLSDSKDSVVCKYGTDSNIAKQLLESQELGQIFQEWYLNGANFYPIENGKDYDSGLKVVQYTSPGKNFIRDGLSYYFGLGHANINHMGSFKLQYRATIDCERKEVRLRIRAYNVWSIESLLRNPANRRPLVEGQESPKVHMVIEIDTTRPFGR